MGKFQNVLLASDFDDTLYGSDRTVSPENVEAISYFIREGGYFTVATGRARPTFARYFHLAPINAPVIISNGSAIHDFRTGQTIYETFLPERVREDLMETAAAIPAVGFEAYHGDTIYLHNPNQVTWNHLQRAGCTGTELPIAQMTTPFSKVILQQERAVLEEVRAYMAQRWSEHYEIIFSNDVLLELTAKGSNKGGMVLRLADYLGVDRKDLYCVGDNENDIPMLAVSAIPFAPSNCAPVVREWGPRIMRSCDEGCIAQIIQVLDDLY